MASSDNRRRGFMKSSNIVMSLYRAAKPSTWSVQCQGQLVKPDAACVGRVIDHDVYAISPLRLPEKEVSFNKPAGSFMASDGYVHGPSGCGGDNNVDARATDYISLVKQRFILERVDYD